jgi:uncharacterized membrane protein
MHPKTVDLSVIGGVTVAASIVTGLATGGPVRALLALPLVIALPGYALLEASFPRRAFGLVERWTLTIGLSVAMTVLGGLVLNLTPWGLRTGTWALLLGGITLGACGVAFMRRRRQPADIAPTRFVFKLGPRDGLLVGMAVVVAVVAITLATVSARQNKTSTFTQIWLLPDTTAASPTVRVGIQDEEGTTMTYRVQLSVGGAVVHEWSAIVLRNGSRWETTYPLSIALPSKADTIEATLYRGDRPTEVYRWVTLQQPG